MIKNAQTEQYYYNGMNTLFYWSNFVFINYYEKYINKQVPYLAESYRGNYVYFW